jgi:arylformamidase
MNPADTSLHDSLSEREREYSPSSCIGGNYQPFIEAYVQRSAQARQQAEDLGGRWVEFYYGQTATQRMDLCLPAQHTASQPEGCALLVFIHGGYWQELSARDSLFAAAQCIERGVAFCAVDYTLAPQASVADIVAECRVALRTLARKASSLGIDASRIVVSGSSAGAHLAAMVCLERGREERFFSFRPQAAVLISGIYALEPLVGTSINDALDLDVSQAREQSPLLQPLMGFPPALVCWGEIETQAFKQQSLDFADALSAAGTPVEIRELAGRNHFDVALDLADQNSPLGRRTLDFLRA